MKKVDDGKLKKYGTLFDLPTSNKYNYIKLGGYTMILKKTMGILVAGCVLLGNVTYAQANGSSDEAVPVLYETQTQAPLLISAKEEGFKSEIDYKNLIIEFKGKTIQYDIEAQLVEGIFMVPLRHTLEEMDYKVTWNNKSKSVEISKGAQYTSINIGSNSYYKNKMAPIQLSSAPVIIEGRTLVPVEFLTEIIGNGVTIENNVLKIHDEPFASRSGYIYKIEEGDQEWILTITTEKQTTQTFAPESTDRIIVHLLKDSSIVNRGTLDIEDFVTVVHYPVMTMIFPAETSALIIY
ncbi:MAG: hypothetical protein CVU84_11880 [Firmicutes bacterium HGW-Firmicutes-1]|jgi:hypothetical protein|nr:MAG: hypothetical protein CVU84_11880 [Firmicutes bacterium HGW-Firmicutes-1]